MKSTTHPDIIASLKPFTLLSETCQRHLAEAPENGIKVAGIYCAFAPEELMRAAGMIPVTLCGKDEAPIAAAETELPAALCPLIKSSYGFALSGTCPYFAAADVIIGETTCDGKKKMFERMANLKPVHVMQLPYAAESESAKEFWRSEVNRLKEFIEEQTGHTITDEALAAQADLINARNQKLMEIANLMARPLPPMTGKEMLMVMESRNVAVDIPAYIDMLDELLKTIRKVTPKDATHSVGPRILLTGCPMGSGSDKVLKIIEELGGQVVAQEHCGGLKSIFRHIEKESDMLTALADHYLGTPCACMSPNIKRLEFLLSLVRQFHADAVVDATLQNCHPYTVEHTTVAETLENQCGIPVLHVNTGYSPSDTEQIRVRVEAFLEMV
ncbi:2-hydroxyglutaryl-CoA dehydratase [Desulfoluna limicola]|uniref:2-hydroxyglutaryl-CoA dehydratase n=1 Tax=Desulfoluna limicola TaxID=2810562 RepID=A0ABM7PHX6_9BACT|nr:double-cubane-cluster-containing anaerobic reductase [Desulfoluna limicola]BCS96960.1 2-hydroxyglutaryl-CoA dehydratase [Desulfoluna limicola]